MPSPPLPLEVEVQPAFVALGSVAASIGMWLSPLLAAVAIVAAAPFLVVGRRAVAAVAVMAVAVG